MYKKIKNPQIFFYDSTQYFFNCVIGILFKVNSINSHHLNYLKSKTAFFVTLHPKFFTFEGKQDIIY